MAVGEIVAEGFKPHTDLGVTTLVTELRLTAACPDADPR